MWPFIPCLAFAAAETGGAAGADEADPFRAAREHLVRTEVAAAGVTDPAVLAALRRVPRHRFVPERFVTQAYADHPLPIGHGQTISQPSLVGLMTQFLALTPDARVLEVGTGSGYQAAVLAEIVREVYSVEIVAPLAREAAARLAQLGYARVAVRAGDGYAGWPEAAPFDAIIVTCAPERVPPALRDQLKPGGRLCIPVGPAGGEQELRLLEKGADGALRLRAVLPVRFVPMTGRVASPP
jgi:protein-L-isoaspartate(D-aspartate) O-methyltransferase